MSETIDQPAAYKPRIIVVDDMQQNLVLLQRNLSRDYDVVCTNNGEKALELALHQPPQLFLLDVNMPDIDGFDVCRRIKSKTSLASIPVVFITARTDIMDILRGFEVGGVDYVTKPFNAAELRARIRTHIQLYQLRSMMSICCYCNRIKNEVQAWERVDSYIHRKTGAKFSHGICPDCLREKIPQFAESNPPPKADS